MRHTSLTKLFWGLFFLFVKISVLHLEMLTTSLGVILLVTALWKLSQNGPKMRAAFVCGVVFTGFQAASLVLLCWGQGSEVNFSLADGYQVMGNLAVAVCMSVAGTVCFLFLLYFLFDGLHALVEREGDGVLAARLSRCFGLYFLTVLLSYFAFVIPWLTILFVIPYLVIIIYILVQVYRFGLAADDNEALAERRLGRHYFSALAGVLAAVVCVSYAALVLRYQPAVPVQAYAPQSGEAQLRQKLKTLSVRPEIIADLPDTEILNYENAQSVRISAQEHATADGGRLRITQIAARLPEGKYRFLDYYEWITLPRCRCLDFCSVQTNTQVLSVNLRNGVEGVALYDEKTANGNVTKKAGFLNQNESGGGSEALSVSYRVFRGKAFHQRGYFAYDAQALVDAQAMITDVVLNYSHQTSLFNFEEPATGQKFQLNRMTFTESSYAEQQFQFAYTADFNQPQSDEN